MRCRNHDGCCRAVYRRQPFTGEPSICAAFCFGASPIDHRFHVSGSGGDVPTVLMLGSALVVLWWQPWQRRRRQKMLAADWPAVDGRQKAPLPCHSPRANLYKPITRCGCGGNIYPATLSAPQLALCHRGHNLQLRVVSGVCHNAVAFFSRRVIVLSKNPILARSSSVRREARF